MIDTTIQQLILQSTQHRCFYHFTDRRNLELIRAQGGILSMKNIEKKQLKVPAPGGNQWSHDADKRFGMDSFVHLCFTQGHPMAHLAQQDGRIQNLHWLKINPEILKLPNVKITNDVSNKAGIEPMSVQDALKAIDLEIIYKRTDWKKPEIRARLDSADKYEILVPEIVAAKFILNLDG